MYSKKSKAVASVVAASTALAVGASSAALSDGHSSGTSAKPQGEYRSGDFHNHTVCSDGITSVRTLTRQSLDRQDWAIQVGHSGSGTRDCYIDDFLYHTRKGGGGAAGLWSNTRDPSEFKGDEKFTEFTIKNHDGTEVVQKVRNMWRWQMQQDYMLPQIVDVREQPGYEDKVAFLGLEQSIPGHEHVSTAIITGQYDAEPRADLMAQYEYCFGRGDADMSQGGGQGWTCEISSEHNEMIIGMMEGRTDNQGIVDYNSSLIDGKNPIDDGEHVRGLAGVVWMKEKAPMESFFVEAHIERQGAYAPDSAKGFNVEHIRDYNEVAPDIAFGFESQPGHQAVRTRGSYAGRRPTAGFWTYGGTGAYSAAEVTKPGLDFDGNPINPETQCFEGEKCTDISRVVLARPGVRTLWDALLSEGRRFWFFGSSDWHSRGSFGPLDYESTVDFWPGEYQHNWTYVVDNNLDNPAQDIVDALRSGNTYVTQGDIVTDLEFKACSNGVCAPMGGELMVSKGDRVDVFLTVTDPDQPNNSPYHFNNPSLLQIGQAVPLSNPKLVHVDMITGVVGQKFTPQDESYFDPMAPETTKIAKQWAGDELGEGEQKKLVYSFVAETDSYVRSRGSNIPAGTPNERDMNGNPLPDNLSDNIACTDPACPPHINGYLDADVEAWADVFFYTNPIFITLKS